jgi:hypothetical protein
MFRDRVVSLEQTLEGGEKHLELLKALCREAFPEFEYQEHSLEHERDLFVLDLAAPDGRRKSVRWTRMVLFDAERIPSMASDPSSPLREKLVSYLRSRAERPEIVVTFRHLEEGWVDTPEPRREGRRRRRGRGRGGERPAAVANAGARGDRDGRDRDRDRDRGRERGRQGESPRREASTPGGPGRPRPVPAPGAPAPGGSGTAAAPDAAAPGRSSRRRSRRRRRGRGGGGGGGGGAGPAAPGAAR